MELNISSVESVRMEMSIVWDFLEHRMWYLICTELSEYQMFSRKFLYSEIRMPIWLYLLSEIVSKILDVRTKLLM